MKLSSLWKKLFERKYLLITNTVSSGLLFVVGDAIQQKLELVKEIHPSSAFDRNRSFRLFLVGLSQGPPHHIFYLWLDKVLPKRSLTSISKKILLDQLIAAPFLAATFFLAAGLLEGKNIKGCIDEFILKFPSVYLFDWCVWPPTQAINFYYVPIQYRVLYINAVTVGWDVYLSYIKHRIHITHYLNTRYSSAHYPIFT